MASPQVENGHTKIANELMEALIGANILGSELQVCLFVIRKTYGYRKLEDEISLTQFEQALNKSRPTIVKAIKNLRLVNILKLVKYGNSINSSNVYSLNKDFDTWKLGKTPKLVKSKNTTSKVNAQKLVKTPLHTKEITKENTKERVAQKTVLPDWLDSSLWEEYKDHRKNMKSKLTQRAEELAIQKLSKLRQSGQNIRAVIEQSILNGWKGLFEIKEDKHATGRNAFQQKGYPTKEQRDIESSAERINMEYRDAKARETAGKTV